MGMIDMLHWRPVPVSVMNIERLEHILWLQVKWIYCLHLRWPFFQKIIEEALRERIRKSHLWVWYATFKDCAHLYCSIVKTILQRTASICNHSSLKDYYLGSIFATTVSSALRFSSPTRISGDDLAAHGMKSPTLYLQPLGPTSQKPESASLAQSASPIGSFSSPELFSPDCENSTHSLEDMCCYIAWLQMLVHLKYFWVDASFPDITFISYQILVHLKSQLQCFL